MTDGSIEVIHLTGELDIGRRDEVHDALRVRGGESGILLDCQDVSYADSTALAELVRFHHDAGIAGVPVALFAAGSQFTRIIQYAGLHGVFTMFGDRASALTYLSQSSTPP